MSQNQLQPMNIDSPLRWKGGKHGLRGIITPLIPKHNTYIEVFCGAAWIFFYKSPSRVEVINDLNGDLMNFFRCVKYHPDELSNSFEWELYSREHFNFTIDARDNKKTDIQRAHDFFIENRSHFGANMARVKNWGYSRTTTTNGCHFNFGEFAEFIKPAYKRLMRAFIENDSFEKIIPRYDAEDAFFFCDPPYYQLDDYGEVWTEDRFLVFKTLLSECKGKWMVTLNQHEFIENLFKDFYQKKVQTDYTIGGGDAQFKKDELIITNYPLKETIKHGLGISSLEDWCPQLEA